MHCNRTSCGAWYIIRHQVLPTAPTAHLALLPGGSMATKISYLFSLMRTNEGFVRLIKASREPQMWRKCFHRCFVKYAFLESPTVERKNLSIGNVSIWGIFYFDLWKRSTAAHRTFSLSDSPLAPYTNPVEPALSVQLRTSAGVLADRIFRVGSLNSSNARALR